MDNPWFVRRPVGDLRPGDHALLTYAGEAERRDVVGAFVRRGLNAEDKVIYLAGPGRAAGPTAVPGADAADLGGRLSVLALDESCRDDGLFDPHRVVGMLGAEIARAERAGYRSIRVTADLTWAVSRPDGLGPLLSCERHIDRAVAPSTSVIAICQFDRRACGPAGLAELREMHSVLVAPDPEFEDAVLRIDRTFHPAGLSLGGELDASRHAVFSEALSATLARNNGHPVHLDLAELDFIDLGALNMLADAAVRRADHGPLVLDRLSPQLRSVMEVVGWDMLPGLRLGDTS